MIRFIICSAFIGLFLILSIPVFLVEMILGKYKPHLRDISSLRIVQFAFKVTILISGIRITVLGKENIPTDRASLFVGNHNGFFDIVILHAFAPSPMGFVAKKEMEKIPLLRTWMRNIHCLFLDRQNPKEGLKMILKGIEEVKNGISICIFPEGTRSRDGKMLPFKEGSLKIAEKSGCPIVPVAFCNTAAVFENQFPKLRPVHVILEYGTPFTAEELSPENRKFIGAYTQNIIQQMYDTNKVNIQD